MAKNFKELEAKMAPERLARSNARVQKMLAEMPLNELRKARDLTQTRMARLLGVKQPAVSKIEQGVDMYVSTLRSYIQAMGGELSIEAIFPDGRVRVDQLKELKQKFFSQRTSKKTAGRYKASSRSLGASVRG